MKMIRGRASRECSESRHVSALRPATKDKFAPVWCRTTLADGGTHASLKVLLPFEVSWVYIEVGTEVLEHRGYSGHNAIVGTINVIVGACFSGLRVAVRILPAIIHSRAAGTEAIAGGASGPVQLGIRNVREAIAHGSHQGCTAQVQRCAGEIARSTNVFLLSSVVIVDAYGVKTKISCHPLQFAI